jgi:hypothetical protein
MRRKLKELSRKLKGFDIQIDDSGLRTWIIIRNDRTTTYRWPEEDFHIEKLINAIEENLTKKHIYGQAREDREDLLEQLLPYSRKSKISKILGV